MICVPRVTFHLMKCSRNIDYTSRTCQNLHWGHTDLVGDEKNALDWGARTA